jgi:hypothetical protein
MYYSKSTIPAVSTPTESEFKGFPVLTLPCPGDASKPGVQLGVKKIAAVLANIEACRAFVAKHEKPKASSPKQSALAAALKAAGASEEMIAGALAALAA